MPGGGAEHSKHKGTKEHRMSSTTVGHLEWLVGALGAKAHPQWGAEAGVLVEGPFALFLHLDFLPYGWRGFEEKYWFLV